MFLHLVAFARQDWGESWSRSPPTSWLGQQYQVVVCRFGCGSDYFLLSFLMSLTRANKTFACHFIILPAKYAAWWSPCTSFPSANSIRCSFSKLRQKTPLMRICMFLPACKVCKLTKSPPLVKVPPAVAHVAVLTLASFNSALGWAPSSSTFTQVLFRDEEIFFPQEGFVVRGEIEGAGGGAGDSAEHQQ